MSRCLFSFLVVFAVCVCWCVGLLVCVRVFACLLVCVCMYSCLFVCVLGCWIVCDIRFFAAWFLGARFFDKFASLGSLFRLIWSRGTPFLVDLVTLELHF